jgi:hypothetical protein
MDLVSVVTHELGHALGFGHSDGPGLMETTLMPGVQLSPTAVGAAGGGSAPSTGSMSSLNGPTTVPAPSSGGAALIAAASSPAPSGGSITQSTASPTQPSAPIASPASAPSILSAIGSTPILVMAPSGTMSSQTTSVLSGMTAAAMDGIAAVRADARSVLIPVPRRMGEQLEGDGRGLVLWDRRDSAGGGPPDHPIPVILPDDIPWPVPAATAAPVAKVPPLDAPWRSACESYLENEVAPPAQVEDASLNPALEPIAAAAALGVGLGISTSLASRAPASGWGGPTGAAQPRSGITQRRPGRLSRWLSLCLGRQA